MFRDSFHNDAAGRNELGFVFSNGEPCAVEFVLEDVKGLDNLVRNIQLGRACA